MVIMMTIGISREVVIFPVVIMTFMRVVSKVCAENMFIIAIVVKTTIIAEAWIFGIRSRIVVTLFKS